MAIQSKPIPALYVVYILRSAVSPASLYIGSTPNPPRRLNQHNGKVKGGAARTARERLRPWEMVGVVSGFPSTIGALKFEWALNNPHLSLHISHEERLTVATQRKRNGMPKRPRHSMASILSNLHLLLRVPSFARWPLKLHFFDREVHDKWGKYCSKKDVEPLPKTLEVATDFEPVGGQATTGSTQTDFLQDDSSLSEDAASEKDDEVAVKPVGPKWGIHALPLDHSPLTPYLEKGQDIITFEREGTCVVCHEHLDHGKGLYAICSHGSCEGVGHLNCWSRHILHQPGENQDSAVILPMQGRCPNCDGVVRWGDMMRELTLRTRGQKEVDKLLKRSRKAAGTKKTKTKSPAKGKGKTNDAATSVGI